MNRYVVADLHGQLDLLTQIEEYINEDDILYVLGDSGDRGPEPWRTIKACLDNPQIVYLMGKQVVHLIIHPIAKLIYALYRKTFLNGASKCLTDFESSKFLVC